MDPLGDGPEIAVLLARSLLRDRRRVYNTLLRPYHPHRISARASVSKKNLNSDDHFDRSFSPYRDESQTSKPKERKQK
jgi:hypothetical protein